MNKFKKSVTLVDPIEDFPMIMRELYGLSYTGKKTVEDIKEFCEENECWLFMYNLTSYVRYPEKSPVSDIISHLPHVTTFYDEPGNSDDCDGFLISSIPEACLDDDTLESFCKTYSCDMLPGREIVKRYTFRIFTDCRTLCALLRLTNTSIMVERMKNPTCIDYVTFSEGEIMSLVDTSFRGNFNMYHKLIDIIAEIENIVFPPERLDELRRKFEEKGVNEWEDDDEEDVEWEE